MKILFATENESKSKRFKDGLLKNNIEIITIKDLDKKVEIEENGKNAIENALIKARAYANIYDYPVFAMDDNLYIDDIPEEKQPGMFVRRVNGKRLNDEEMIDYYSNLAHVYGKDGKLTCRWVYGIAVIKDGIESTYTWSKEDFYIVDKLSNKIDPGYPLNTISINKKLNKYFTDMTPEDKKEVKEDEKDVVEFLCQNLLSMKTIETQRFYLSTITMEDVDSVYKILSKENVIVNLNMEIHKSIEDTKKLIENYISELGNKTKFPYKITDKKTGEFIGVFLNKLDLYDEDCFEFTIYLDEKYWGMGIYTEILPYMIDSAFEVAKTSNYRGFVKESNLASRKVLEKSNLKLEKIFNVPGIDEKIYSFLITKKEWENLKK